ncbi:putative aarF domain-containing protein kinase chloroplastic-like, partial [Trifolium medium]|nr:putative aarF domain-containing protein kinase chloroplastic-like [Trifolium medium]
STSNVALRATRIRAAKDESALAERVNDVELSGNGVASRAGINGAARGYVNGAVNGGSSEYGYGNGNGVAVTEVVDVEASKVNEDGRKRRLEEIGKEDAWFKQTEKEKVAVAPGGRWSRFKTYSTIQRTLEIWGFVVTFVFKAWLDNQKFSYK